jgi:hypothetical protein
MKWVEALKIWNHGKRTVNTSQGWFVPKKGTKEYDEVRDIMTMEKTPEHEKILSVKSERTVKKQERKQAKKEKETVEKPKRTRKAKEKKEEPKGLSEAERKAEEAKFEGMNKDRRAKALEQLKAFEKQIKESNLEKAKKAETMSRVVKAREDIEASVKPIREAKAKGGFRGQIIQKQRSKYLTLLKDIDFFAFDKQSPLNNKEVLKEFGKDMNKKRMINDKFRIFKNLDKLTKDKFVLEKKEELEARISAKGTKMPPVKDVDSSEFLEKSVKFVFGSDEPKGRIDTKVEEMKEIKEKMEEKKEEVKEEVKEESSSDEEDSLESKEKRLAKMKDALAFFENRMKTEDLGSGVKKEHAKLKKKIKEMEKEIASMKPKEEKLNKKIKEMEKEIASMKPKEEKAKEEKAKEDLPPPSTKSKEQEENEKNISKFTFEEFDGIESISKLMEKYSRYKDSPEAKKIIKEIKTDVENLLEIADTYKVSKKDALKEISESVSHYGTSLESIMKKNN